jgi:hypothetical protein
MGVQVMPATGRWDDFASLMVPRKPGGSGCARPSNIAGGSGQLIHACGFISSPLPG